MTFVPTPQEIRPLSKEAIFLGIPPPGDEYSRNTPPEGLMPQEYRPPFRIFASHICDVVYSNNFVINFRYLVCIPCKIFIR
jgi:hypothetical protein